MMSQVTAEISGFVAASSGNEEEHPQTANEFVENALKNDKREGLLLAVKARWVGLAIIAPLLVYINQNLDVLYYLVLLAGFAAIGYAQLQIGRVGRSRAELALILCDLALLTFTLVYPNPFREDALPLAMQYRFGGFLYFFFLLAGATLAYSWRTLVAMGVWTIVIWMGAFTWVWLHPIEFPEMTQAIQAAIPSRPEIWKMIDPNEPHFNSRLQEVTLFMIVAATLAIGGWRSKQLLMNHAEVERERTNLARYFSPNVVEELSNNDDPLKQIRTQNVCVLFVDIFGFTSYSENRDPREVIDTLREFHGQMEHEVFRHSGTLDKYLGDGLMATFGTPSTSPTDASNALRCAREMIEAVYKWNRLRQANGDPALRVGFGLHYGPAVLGDIGTNRLEFAVIGSTINIASRLEALTRELDVALVVSDALVQKTLKEPESQERDIQGLELKPAQTIRGLAKPIEFWTLDEKPFTN